MNLWNRQIPQPIREQGGILISTLFIIGGIMIGIGSYLVLVRAQYVSVSRSQAWNGALVLAEFNSTFRFTKVSLIPVTGDGQRLR